jgi:hypothetical protein
MLWWTLSGIANAVEPRVEATLAATEWPLGVRATFRPGWTQHLWGREDDILFKDTYARAVADIVLTPSYVRAGPEIGFSPIAVLELNAQVVFSQYFGTFSSLIGFSDPATAPTNDVLQEEIDLGRRDQGWGIRFGGGATLQGQFGPVIVLLDGTLRHWITHPGPAVQGPYIYEPEVSLMLAREDTTFEYLGLLGYELPDARDDRSLLFGSGTLGSLSMVADDASLKTGLVGVYRFDHEHWTVLALVAPYVFDRTYTTAFPPYVAAQAKWLL